MEKLTTKTLKEKRIHFIGIGGISMSALAQMLWKAGCYVQGSDLSENDEVKILKKKGIMVYHGHDARLLKGIDVVVYSSAIHEDNCELEYAISHGIKLVKRAELLGCIAESYKTVISVAGSHGKTTTTAMISEIFMRAGQKPTIHVGGPVNSIHSNYKIGNKSFFITESCEYMDNYLFVKPDIAVVLNVDSDHLDYFKSLDGVKSSFLKFSKNLREGGICLACTEDENSAEIRAGERVLTFGMDKNSDIFAKNIKEYAPCFYSFDVVFCGCNLGNVRLNILGAHNINNALASILVSLSCGIDFEIIKEALEAFSGVERRCQKMGTINGATIFHDYAHHPKQIEKMVEVGRELTSKTGGKLIVVFEPHTYSRTMFLLDEFAQSFKGCDSLILAPVYSAREAESEGKNSLELAEACKDSGIYVEYYESYAEIAGRIKCAAREADIVMVLGAGTIETLAKNLVKENEV